MNKHLISLVLFFVLVFFVGCTKDKIRLSGNPSEVLDTDTYNILQRKYQTINKFQDGTAVVKKDRYGLIDCEGNELLSCEFDSIYSLKKNYRIIVKNNRFGAVNIDGKIIKQCVYTEAYNSGCKYLAMKMNDKWGFIDEKGNDITQYKYEGIRTYNDTTFLAKYDGLWGLCDYNHNILIPFEYDEIRYKWNEKCPVTIVRKGEFYGLYNSYNQKVLECEYEEFLPDSSGYVSIKKNSLMGLIEEETGKIMIPFIYKYLRDYSEGLIAAENQNRKYGYLDVNGNIILPFVYDDAGNFSEGLAAVYRKTGNYMNTIGGLMEIEKCGYIDKKGNVVIPFQYQIGPSMYQCEFHEGLAVQGYTEGYLIARSYGYINKQGEWVIKPQYDDANRFKNGVAQVVLDKKIGYINAKGEQIIPCLYDEYSGWFVNDSTLQMTKDEVIYYFNLKGKPVSEPN